MKCDRCDYYHAENNTCSSKKCATGLEGYVTWFDKLFCSPYNEKERNDAFDFGVQVGEQRMQDFVENKCRELGIDYIQIFTSEASE